MWGPYTVLDGPVVARSHKNPDESLTILGLSLFAIASRPSEMVLCSRRTIPKSNSSVDGMKER